MAVVAPITVVVVVVVIVVVIVVDWPLSLEDGTSGK